jgi:DNA-binding CsgD family transcriptional regulator
MNPRQPEDSEFDLAELWHSLVEGRLAIAETTVQDGRCLVRLGPPSRSEDPVRYPDILLLQQVLCGEQQKVVADDAHLSPSTLSVRCSRTLRAIGSVAPVSRASMALVMAAHSAGGLPLPRARMPREATGGTVIRIEMPGSHAKWPVSAGEAVVLRMTLEGRSSREIALARGTSPRTVANQLAAIFGKLRVSGRAALKAWAVQEHSRAWLMCETGDPLNAGRVVLPRPTTLLAPSLPTLPQST